ncbi:hypothetical protein WJX81_007346 [Elliptochloris bilobata]|uniref:NAD-dependent epimerase/dehydratase domain-containing protein n=1 Tax=Elliptochloris bilobata TaxID=381761 RepID=A0AAW1RVB8_9CHLO
MHIGRGGRRKEGSSNSGIVATVFGCSGFLARYVVNSLARQGSQVVMPYRCDDLDCQHLRLMGDLGQMVALKGFNIRDDEAVRYAIRRSNLVVNCIGAERETWNYEFEEVHVDIARRIAEACAANPIVERLMHVSCLSAAPDAPSERLRTKAAGDAAVRAAMPNATIFKPGPLIGNEDRLTNNIAQLGKKYAIVLLVGDGYPVIPLVGGGRARLQPVYVRDVADGMINSLRSRDAIGQDFYMAGPDVLTLRSLYKLVFETMREPFRPLPVPTSIAKALAIPRERLYKKLPIPWNTMFTADFIDEMTADHVLPEGVLTLKDLGVDPRSVTKGVPIEHIRHMRSGGYDYGTTYQLPASKHYVE